MKYQFKFRNTAFDMTQITLAYLYKSYSGTVNIIFTLAAIALLVSSIHSGNTIIAVAAGIGCIFFPVIQPIAIYFKCKKITNKTTDDTELSVTDEKIYIKVGEQNQELEWKDVLAVQKLLFCIILYIGKGHGIAIPNRALNDKKSEFYKYALSIVQKLRKGK